MMDWLFRTVLSIVKIYILRTVTTNLHWKDLFWPDFGWRRPHAALIHEGRGQSGPPAETGWQWNLYGCVQRKPCSVKGGEGCLKLQKNITAEIFKRVTYTSMDLALAMYSGTSIIRPSIIRIFNYQTSNSLSQLHLNLLF